MSASNIINTPDTVYAYLAEHQNLIEAQAAIKNYQANGDWLIYGDRGELLSGRAAEQRLESNLARAQTAYNEARSAHHAALAARG